jgi:hypothetical protein
VLSTPPAFVLSQDQTLQQKPVEQSIQATNQTKLVTKENQNQPHKRGQLQPKLWHWHYKHPVEFSKNNHTPENHPHNREDRPRGNFSTLPTCLNRVKSLFRLSSVKIPDAHQEHRSMS